MIEYTLGGWPAIQYGNDARLATGKVPGTNKSVTLRKEILPVFLAFLAEVNKKVIPLNPGPLDGWEYRKARSANGLSQHAGACATDMRYDVLKADHRRHMTQAQINAMHKLMDKYVTSSGKRVFGWGGDWQVGKFCDEMHLEAIQNWSPGSHGENATVKDFQNVQKRLGIRSNGTTSIIQPIINIFKPAPKPPKPVPAPKPNPVDKPVPVPKPTPKPAPKPVPKPAPIQISLASVQPGKKNKQVAIVQQALHNLKHYSGPANGVFDKSTRDAYSHWQTALGYKGADANGVPGIKSLTELGKKAGFTVVA
jgi:D-alanyl-D-alanine carboxypeptidase